MCAEHNVAVSSQVQFSILNIYEEQRDKSGERNPGLNVIQK